jgi:hypothetical protein
MTLRDLGPQALVSRNMLSTSISDERLRKYELGRMDTTATVCSPENLKYFPYINTCKNSFLYCGPIQPPVAMILTNFFYDIIKLLCKFQLFRPSGS